MNTGDELVQEKTKEEEKQLSSNRNELSTKKKLALISTHDKISFIFIESTKILLLLIYH